MQNVQTFIYHFFDQNRTNFKGGWRKKMQMTFCGAKCLKRNIITTIWFGVFCANICRFGKRTSLILLYKLKLWIWIIMMHNFFFISMYVYLKIIFNFKSFFRNIRAKKKWFILGTCFVVSDGCSANVDENIDTWPKSLWIP